MSVSKRVKKKFRDIDKGLARLTRSDFPTHADVAYGQNKAAREKETEEIKNWFATASPKQRKALSRILKSSRYVNA